MPSNILRPLESKSNFIFPKILRNFFKPSHVNVTRLIERNTSAPNTSRQSRRESYEDVSPSPTMLPIFSYHGNRRRSSTGDHLNKASVVQLLAPPPDVYDAGYYSYNDLNHQHLCDRTIASTTSTNSSGHSSIDDDEKLTKSNTFNELFRRRGSLKTPRHKRAASLKVNPQRSDCWNLHKNHLQIEHQGHRRVMIAIDNSQSSERAFRWFLDYMMEPCDRVILVTIVDPKLRISSGMTPVNFRDSEADVHNMMLKSQLLMQRFLQRAGPAKMICEAHAYMSCKQADSLVTAARFHKADVIVMGSRGTNSSLKGFLLGSISKSVLRTSTIPVTIVPPYDLTPSQDDAQIKVKPKTTSKDGKPRKHSL